MAELEAKLLWVLGTDVCFLHFSFCQTGVFWGTCFFLPHGPQPNMIPPKPSESGDSSCSSAELVSRNPVDRLQSESAIQSLAGADRGPWSAS